MQPVAERDRLKLMGTAPIVKQFRVTAVREESLMEQPALFVVEQAISNQSAQLAKERAVSHLARWHVSRVVARVVRMDIHHGPEQFLESALLALRHSICPKEIIPK